ncbi:C40 family peptidase [Curtobacterium sp. MCBD17_003]|uniref:C40 family peptidase n=1 Tax=Curtobacterium sp. MCBD17_003 TaxID=2175667 RepID=UPI000DA77332|nr:C40 family peptidase [Curtobacterium sp. MCBD17_003]WIE54726.1 NlpC/P60 family protein [Curtobacterium sp. MCBD17_003]
MKPARVLIGGAATLAVLGLTFTVAAPASASPSAPSWADVQAAKQSQAATQHQVDTLTSSLDALQTQAERASVAEQQAGEAYQRAASRQQAAQTRVDTLTRQSKQAEAKAKVSAQQVAGLVVELSRTGGGDLSTAMLVDGADAKDLLYQVGTMSHLSARSAGILADAEADQRQVDALQHQASAAETALGKATTAAKTSLSDANDQAASAAGRLKSVQDQQSTLFDQLAYLKGTTATTEAAYFADQQAKQAERAIATSTTSGGAGTTKAAATGSTGTTASKPAASKPTGSKPTGSKPTGTGTAPKPATAPAPKPVAPAPKPVAAPKPAAPAPKPAAPAPKPVTAPAPKPAAPAPKPPTSSTGSSSPSKGSAALAFASAQIGKPYLFGAAGPNSYDCSGLVMAAYSSVGVAVGGHRVDWQYEHFAALGRLVPLSQAQPGDIIFYSTTGTNPAGMYHDTIYAGGGRMVEAPKPGLSVRNYAVYTYQIVPYVARPTGSL